MFQRARPLASAGLVAVLVVPAFLSAGAQAQTSYTVEIGRFFDEDDHTKESMRFFPAAISVHQGDTLRFTTRSFHGVVLLPPDTDVDEWTSANAGGESKPWSMFLSDPDDGVQALKANLSVMAPSLPCGWPTQPACSFDGRNGALGSGLALFPGSGGPQTTQLDFRVTIDADPGETVVAVDPIHPAMRMTIAVVAEGEAASSRQELDAASDAGFAADAATAAKLHRQFSKKRVSKVIRGKRFWTAWAGVETPTVSLRAMYPRQLTIKKGEGVSWSFGKNVFSSHTVTFPVARGTQIAGAFPQIACDPDGDFPSADDEPLADTAPSSASPPFCDEAWQLELDVPGELAYAVGDGKVAGAKDFETSGVRGRGLAETAASYRLLFPKASPKAGFSYMDMVYELAHAPMRGRVVVRR